ncbi:MAG: pilus assembly protein PilP [Deltaproteobacteria bacterium]|nr:pilus assembly protein PilP [Deltaproteobacteria bacterium]
MSTSRGLKRAAWFFPLAMILGCGESIEQAPEKKKAAAAAKKPAVEADPEPESRAQWFYNPAGKRDPFASFVSRQIAAEAVSPDAPPLQRWDTDKFSLTGVIWDVDAPRALLVDPEGIGHVVRMGTYVGRNWGKVTAIAEAGIVVTEEYRTIDGELVVNPVSIRFGIVRKK